MFTKILNELRASGLSENAIAEQVLTTQETINRLRNGRVTEPGFGLGQRIVDLHKRVTEQKAAA